MAEPNYAKKTIDLTAVRERERILDSGIALPDVTVLRLSVAAEPDVFLHFGEGKDEVDLSQGWVFHMTPPVHTGLYLTVKVAHPGETLKLLLGYAAGGAPQATE